MNSCNRAIVSVLVFIVGCGAEAPVTTSVIQNVGLVSTSSTPPLGEGVAPLDGTGGDGSPSVAGRGSAEGGPGAVRWYGGQWLIPYAGTPGTTIQNVSCDVIPNASSTDLIELVGSAGVIGSVTVPAVTGVTIRAWITRTHVIADGEVITMRHSPRDSATGAWTSGVQQTTIVGCAVNVVSTRTLSIPLIAPLVTTSGVPASLPLASSATTIVIPFSLPIGSTITATHAVVHDNLTGPTTLKVGLLTFDGVGTGAASASGFGAASAGTGEVQLIASAPMTSVVGPGRWYAVEVVYASGNANASVGAAEVDYLP